MNVTNETKLPRYNETAAGNITTEGGNISGTNLNSTQLTKRWAAFYGDVMGNIILKGATGSNYVYSWAWSPSAGGTICLSTNSTIGSFTAFPANGSDIDTAWGFAPVTTDSGTNTFNATNCTMSIGSSAVSNAAYADTGQAGGFMTCAIKSASAPAKAEMMFCSDIISGGSAWNGNPVDFEVLVPTPETYSTTETYYFYANLD